MIYTQAIPDKDVAMGDTIRAKGMEGKDAGLGRERRVAELATWRS